MVSCLLCKAPENTKKTILFIFYTNSPRSVATHTRKKPNKSVWFKWDGVPWLFLMIQLIVVFQIVKIFIKNKAINFHLHNKGKSLSTHLWTRITTCTFWPVRDYFNKFWLINCCLPVDTFSLQALPLDSELLFWLIVNVQCKASKFMSRWSRGRGEKERRIFKYGVLWSNGSFFCAEVCLDVVSEQTRSSYNTTPQAPLTVLHCSLPCLYSPTTPTRADCDKCWLRVT